MKKRSCALLLSLISPLFAEVLTGSTPPLEAANPSVFLLLWAYYGGGVLLFREAWVRWGRGYMRLFFLGAAYGIIEEGLVIRSWFNPAWPDLDVFATYGRFWGVNSVWAVWLTLFHSLMSISMPVMVTDALCPGLAEKPLLRGRWLALPLLPFGLSALMLLFMIPYTPPAVPYVLTLLLVLAVLLLARLLPEDVEKKDVPMKYAFVYAFVSAFALFFIYTVLPHSSLPPVVAILLGPTIVLHLYSRMDSWSSRGRRGLVLGFLAFWFVPYDIVLEVMGFTGEAVLGLSTFALFAWKLGKSPEVR